MLDVFFCSYPLSQGRQEIADRCLDWWAAAAKRGGIWVRHLSPDSIDCAPEDFQRQRRISADHRAEGPEYILTDDDMLPVSDDCIEKGIACLRLHPNFGIVSAWPVNAKINRWEPSEDTMRCLVCFGMRRATGCGNCGGSGVFSYTYQPFEDLTVMEHHSVGGLRFCRKGALTEWPEQDGPGYDQAHCQALRKEGYRSGYSQHARATHLGEGKTEVWTDVQVGAI